MAKKKKKKKNWSTTGTSVAHWVVQQRGKGVH